MGRDKAFLELGGKPLIQHVIDNSAELGQYETILITNKPADYAPLGFPLYRDAMPDKGSLGGIYTALLKAKSDFTLVLACDMPFVQPDLLRFMIAQINDDIDIVVPRVEGYPQGLHAIYRKTCIEPIRDQLAANRLKIIRFFDRMRLRYLDEPEYAPYDPDRRSFMNLNTPAELDEARSFFASLARTDDG